jgi:hypothetical protein
MTGAPDDDRLLELLSQALEQQNPLTERAREGAYAALTWRTVDAELAALSYDSAMELSTGARSDEVARQLTFATDSLEIEIMVAAEGPRLVGQLVPPSVAAVTLTRGGEVLETTSDDLGRFGFDLTGAGPTRISVARGPGQPAVETEWVVL